MTGAMEGQLDQVAHRFPALDPEPPPVSRKRRLAAALAFFCAVAGVVALGLVLGRAGARGASAPEPFGVAVTGRVIALTSKDQLLASRPDGARSSLLTDLGAFGQGLPAVSPDRLFIAGAQGTIVSLAPRRPRLVAAELHLGPAQLISPLSPFSDHDHAVTEIGLGPFGAPTASAEVSVVALSTGAAIPLGIASRAAGDQQRPGVFAVVPGPEVGASTENQIEPPDASVELRDAGASPVPLLSAPAAARAVGLDPSTPVVLYPWPDARGDTVAVTVTPASGSSTEGVVVVDRSGAVKASVLASVGPAAGGLVSWSPDGTTIAYVGYGSTGSEIATWTLGGTVSVRNVPVGDPAASLCIWSPDGSALLCPAATASQFPTRWYLTGSASGPIAVVSAPGLPLVWIPDNPASGGHA